MRVGRFPGKPAASLPGCQIQSTFRHEAFFLTAFYESYENGDKELCNPLLLVSMCKCGSGWSGWDCWGAFVTQGSIFLNLLAKSKLKAVSPTPPFLKCGIHQNAHSECAIKTLWLGLRVLEALSLIGCSPCCNHTFLSWWFAFEGQQFLPFWLMQIQRTGSWERKQSLSIAWNLPFTLLGNFCGEQVEF